MQSEHSAINASSHTYMVDTQAHARQNIPQGSHVLLTVRSPGKCKNDLLDLIGFSESQK